MSLIYFDNFRGFNKTFLPLKNINFFVGENSTGKTSVLKLIRAMSMPAFWHSSIFNSETELGYFDEIISISTPEKKYFEIGILNDRKKGNKQLFSAVRLRFYESHGLAELKEIKLCDDKWSLNAVFENKGFKYDLFKSKDSVISAADSLESFKKWIDSEQLKSKSNKYSGEIPNRSAFSIITSIVNASLKKGMKQNRIEELNEILDIDMPSFLNNRVAWMAPIRMEPKRTYDDYDLNYDPAGKHAPYILKRLLTKNKSSKKQNSLPEEILKKFGVDSGLFDKIEINLLGKSEASPFEIYVVLNGKSRKIINVGYGVSQILPLVIEVIARREGTWFAIQQPEIHLHPRGQAAFGDFILKSNLVEQKNFIIETHSDYTIDRYRLKMNKNSKEKNVNPKSQIVFFKKTDVGNSLSCIDINDDGSLPEDQPKEFREFFVKEQMDLLKV